MTFEQAMLTMINDKMRNSGTISQELYDNIQKNIIVMSPISGNQKNIDSFSDSHYNKSMV